MENSVGEVSKQIEQINQKKNRNTQPPRTVSEMQMTLASKV